MRIFLILAAGLLVSAPAAGCNKKSSSSSSSKSKASRTGPRLVDRVSRAARSWQPRDRAGSKFKVDTAKAYDKKTVFELLNGGADALLDAGLVSLIHVRIKDTAGKFTPCEVQVGDYGSAAKAKAMLAKEKPRDAKPVKVGDKGFASRGTVIFIKGQHLVSVGVQPMGKLPFAPVSEIARQVAATRNANW